MLRIAALLKALALFATSAAAGDALAPGSKAPDFALEGTDGKTRALSQFAGERGIVLAWFPKAFTPG